MLTLFLEALVLGKLGKIIVLERPQSVSKCEGCGAHIKEILKH